LSLTERREFSDDLAEEIASRWPEWTGNEAEYYFDEGRYVHCYNTLAEAAAHLAEECPGGEILEIDTKHRDFVEFDCSVTEGKEFPHPTVSRRIPAGCVRKIDVVVQ
jgi:hypothetical protein